MSISFPVYLLEKDSGSFSCFHSLVDLQRHVERIDVNNDEYDLWDENGFRLRMTVQEPIWLYVSRESEQTDADYLRKKLMQSAATLNGQEKDRRGKEMDKEEILNALKRLKE